MSVHSEIQHVMRNHSGDAVIGIHSRSGDVENGNSFFEFLPSRLANPSSGLLEDESKAYRVEFLKQYFSLLKSVLSPVEYFAVREALKNGGELRAVCKANFLSPSICVSIRKKIQEIQEQIDKLVVNSEWEQAGIFTRYFLRSAEDLSHDKKALDEAQQAIKGRRNIADKINDAIQIRNERRVRLNGFNSGKTYSRNRVLRYLEETVSRVEFRPYLKQYIAEEIKEIVEELKCVIDSFLSERMLDFALNKLGDPNTEEMKFTRVFFNVAAKELNKIASALEAHNLFKNAILSEDVPEELGIIETV